MVAEILMPITVRDGAGTARNIAEIVVRDGTNTPRTISEIWVRDTTNTPRRVYSTASPLSVSTDETLVSGVTSTGTATTNTVTATAADGTAPYSYAWTLVSYSHPSVAPVIGSSATAATSFIQSSIGAGEYYEAIFRVTVTDDNLDTAFADVQAVWSDIS